MGITIHTIPLGIDNVYVVKDKGSVIIDSGAPKKDYGISGKVVYTPGHSSGSVSLLLETGEAFVGDMAMNKFPLRLSPGMPIYAENWQVLVDSWKMLLDEGVKTVYPSHGGPFSADIIRKELS